MGRRAKVSFHRLIEENIKDILQDPEAINKIDQRIEQKHLNEMGFPGKKNAMQ